MSPADDGLKPHPRFIIERQNPRRPLQAGAIIRNITKGEIGGRLVDISEQGCKIELDDAEVSLGQKITIKLETLELWVGNVRWVRGKTIGIIFERPMHSAVVDHLSRSNPTFELS